VVIGIVDGDAAHAGVAERGIVESGATYPMLALVFLVIAVVIVITALSGAPQGQAALRRWIAPAAITLVIVAVLTAVFDSLLIGADVIRYEDRLLAGIRIGLAPIEDFTYPLVAVLLVPSLWSVSGGLRRTRRFRGERVAGPATRADRASGRAVVIGGKGRHR
jgi:lycopene cyclase domain-containing protein